MRLKHHQLIRRFTLAATATMLAMTVSLAWGAGVSFAKSETTSATYYEDSLGDVCVGLQFPTGLAPTSCEWGHVTPNGKNVGIGVEALNSDTSGYYNVAAGYEALQSNTEGAGNVAISHGALQDNTTGDNNTAMSSGALGFNTTGIYNIGLGYGALGQNAEGSYNLAIGNDPGATRASGALIVKSNNIDISNAGATGDEGVTRIGTEGTQTRTFVSGVYGTIIKTPDCTVKVDSEGQLGCKVEKVKKGGSNEPALEAQVSRQQQEIDELASEVSALQKRQGR